MASPEPNSDSVDLVQEAPVSRASTAGLGMQLHNIARSIRGAVYRKIYQDSNRDTARTILVAGTARSGTTWLGELIASQLRCRIMFEPFNPELVSDFSGFSYFQYMRPDQEDAELLDFVRRVLSGQIRHPWIDRHVNKLRPDWRLIKEIRACLFLRWIHERFPEVKIFFIIRHPCAVVASRMKLGWSTDGDISHFLAQPALLEDFLAAKLDIIGNAASSEEKHAIVWCVSNMVALRQMQDAPMHTVFYENLLLHPRQVIKGLFHTIGQPYNGSVLRHAHRASMTTRRNSAIVEDTNPTGHWRRELSAAQVSRVLGIVEGFGLSHLYGDSDLPAAALRVQE